MKRKAEDLVFISKINRDGLGVRILENYKNTLDDFTLFCLSITEGTYIATNFFNYYIVRIKK
jgi:hypothetical protein